MQLDNIIFIDQTCCLSFELFSG